MRGDRDFADLDAYRVFVTEVFARLNARVARKFNEERGMLMALPARLSSDYEEVDARVTKFSTLSVKKVLYTAPSRLVGLKVRVDDLFPRPEYRLMWTHLKDTLTEKSACKLMVGLLDLAGNGGPSLKIYKNDKINVKM